MKKLFVFKETGIITLSLNSCRENEPELYNDHTEKSIIIQNPTAKRDSISFRKISETDPAKDRDNWRMSPYP